MSTSKDSGFSVSQFDRLNAVIAALVFAISFIIYYLTMAPTFSFWDCGEFVSCAYRLGIPHPPGSPLYILVGRIFTLLPTASDIAVRTNLLSVVTSSFTAIFAYLILVRIIRFWFNNQENFYNRIIVYIGGFTGALFVAFSNTNWSNSVESEVYSSIMAIMLAVYWLALKYLSNQDNFSGTRAMMLALFLGVLGVGIHLTIFAIIPVLGLYFILRKDATDHHWMAVSVFFLLELYFIFRLSSRPDEVHYYLTVLIVFIVFLFHILQWKKVTNSVLITLGLYLVSLYSFYFILFDNMLQRFKPEGLSSSMKSLGDIPIGWIGVVGLLIWGAYLLLKHFSKNSKASSKPEQSILAIYSLAPILLIGLGEFFSTFNPYSAFKVLTVLLLLGLIAYLRKLLNWTLVVAIGGMSLIMLGFWQFVWGLAVAGIIIILLGLIFKDKNWKTGLAIIVLAAIAYSVHGYIPVRSAHNPTIDENNPSESMTALVGYLERKQYGAESMTSRMFKRRAEWGNQFGDYRRMGFWGFFEEQYGFDGSKFFICFILGMFGIWETIRRKPSIGLPFMVMTVICTLGIVLYMNFADGTRINPLNGQDYLEVRNRDYFFSAGFIFFGMAIGLGIAGLIALIKDSVEHMKPAVKKSTFAVSSLLMLMPIVPLNVNYFFNDRSRNYMPYDYAYNMLLPCEENSVFITNGDNDTFPVWCIQEVYGYRTDVQTVNLSLANAPWYIKQLAHHGLPISWSDTQIDRLRPYQAKDGTVYRLQDQVVDEIITQNKSKRPIHISVTTPSENRKYLGKSLDSSIILEGMTYRLTDTKGWNMIDYDKTLRMFEHDYSFRGIADPTVYKDEATVRLVNNYSQGILWLADTLRKAGDNEGAFERIANGIKALPQSFDLYGYGTQLLADMGRFDTLETFIEQAPATDRKKELYMQWGHSARAQGNMKEAIKAYELVNKKYPDFEEGFRVLAAVYYREQKIVELKQLLDSWLSRHPDDSNVKQALSEIKEFEKPAQDTEGK